MMIWKRALPVVIAGLAACSESRQPSGPTEQQIHSSDNVLANREVGLHPYRCTDGEPLFVDYSDDGLQINLRQSAKGPPMSLAAPAQGQPYAGKTATAIVKGPQLMIIKDDGRTRTCEREGGR
jgi:hypothetical protein